MNQEETQLAPKTATDMPHELSREYEMCFQRWMSMNGQVWQVPALAIAAQAFLFTILLASDTETLA